eukprot:1029033-Pyramimonas_sp.AAC.1
MSLPSLLAVAMRAAQATSVASTSTPCAPGGCSSAAATPRACSRKLPPISPRSQSASSVVMLLRLGWDLILRPSALGPAFAGSRNRVGTAMRG